jgi:hypothetical protein
MSKLRQKALSLATNNGIALANMQASREKVMHYDNAGVNVGLSSGLGSNTLSPPPLLEYDVYTGDVYLCTFQAFAATVTGHMEGGAKFSMHQQMRHEFHRMTAQQLMHHVGLGNPYAIHEQSVRANDGDLMKAELPPRYDAIRFVLKGAAK